MKLLIATRPTYIVFVLYLSNESIEEVGSHRFPLRRGEEFLQEEVRRTIFFPGGKRNCRSNGVFDDLLAERYVFIGAERSVPNDDGECQVVVRFELLSQSVGCYDLFRACSVLVEDNLWENVQVFSKPRDENERITHVVEMKNPLSWEFSASVLAFHTSTWW